MAKKKKIKVNLWRIIRNLSVIKILVLDVAQLYKRVNDIIKNPLLENSEKITVTQGDLRILKNLLYRIGDTLDIMFDYDVRED